MAFDLCFGFELAAPIVSSCDGEMGLETGGFVNGEHNRLRSVAAAFTLCVAGGFPINAVLAGSGLDLCGFSHNKLGYGVNIAPPFYITREKGELNRIASEN